MTARVLLGMLALVAGSAFIVPAWGCGGVDGWEWDRADARLSPRYRPGL
ncbi:hypothetical protein [Streptomyces sp. NPDC002788]